MSAPRSAPKGWYSRGYLPHCDKSHLIQSVTFRLIDSLPQSKLQQLKKTLEFLTEEQREIEKRKRIEEWMDAGMGCCALAHNQQPGLQIPSSDHLWMREYWDRHIRDAGHYQKVVDYIHQNPVKAKLCREAKDWLWSSAFTGDHSFEADEDVGAPRSFA